MELVLLPEDAFVAVTAAEISGDLTLARSLLVRSDQVFWTRMKDEKKCTESETWDEK